MKKLGITVVLLGFMSGLYGLDPGDSILCVEEENTGFTWKNGKWKAVNFETQKYIVKKIKQDLTYCRGIEDYNKEQVPSGKINLLEGCYNVKAIGGDRNNPLNEVCDELLMQDEKGGFNLIRVSCRHIRFKPNGNFISSFDKSSLSSNPKNDYKDSMVSSQFVENYPLHHRRIIVIKH